MANGIEADRFEYIKPENGKMRRVKTSVYLGTANQPGKQYREVIEAWTIP